MEVDLLKVGVLPDFPLGSKYFPQRFNRPFDKIAVLQLYIFNGLIV